MYTIMLYSTHDQVSQENEKKSEDGLFHFLKISSLCAYCSRIKFEVLGSFFRKPFSTSNRNMFTFPEVLTYVAYTILFYNSEVRTINFTLFSSLIVFVSSSQKRKSYLKFS